MDMPLKTLGIPPKKRAKWMSPPPSHSPEQSSDINVMPQLMRSINRQKRKEHRLNHDSQAKKPPTKPPTHHDGFVMRPTTLEQSVEAAQTLASLGQRGSSQDSVDILAHCYPASNLRAERVSVHTEEDSIERAIADLQSKVLMGHSDLSYWINNTTNFSSLPSSRVSGLCQLTSDSDSRVPIPNLHKRKNPAFNRAA